MHLINETRSTKSAELLVIIVRMKLIVFSLVLALMLTLQHTRTLDEARDTFLAAMVPPLASQPLFSTYADSWALAATGCAPLHVLGRLMWSFVFASVGLVTDQVAPMRWIYQMSS